MSFCPFEELLGLLLQLLKRTKALSRKLLFGQGIENQNDIWFSVFFHDFVTFGKIMY